MINELPTIAIVQRGVTHLSICTSRPIADAVTWANDQHPAGTANGWTLSTDTIFGDGKPMPCPCERYPKTHKHYLLDC